MNLFRLRFLIISCLIILNVLFAGMYFTSMNRKNNLAEQTVLDASFALKNNGIAVSPETIEKSIPRNSVYSYDSVLFERVNNKILFVNNTSLKEYALGKGLKMDSVELTSFEIPNGYTVNISSNGEKHASVTFGQNNTFDYSQFNPNTGVEEVIPKDYFSFDEIIPSREDKKLIKSLLDAFSPSERGVSGFSVLHGYGNENAKVYEICQTLEDARIYNTQTLIYISGGSVRAAVGTGYFGQFTEKYSENQIDGANILFLLNSKASPKVLNEELIYAKFDLNTEKKLFVPAWNITVEENNSEINYIYDAVIGNLYTAEK